MNHLRISLYRTFSRFYTKSSKDSPLISSQPAPSKIDKSLLPPKTRLDKNTIALLQKVSLVGQLDAKNVQTVEEAIEFADQILQVDTTDIEPLYTVLEDCPLRVRDDEVKEGYVLEDLLRNAAIVEEDYFVAPPGNIPESENSPSTPDKDKKVQ